MELIDSPVIKVDEHLTITTSDANFMAIAFMLLPLDCDRPRWCFFHRDFCRGTKNTRFTLTSILDRTGRHRALFYLSVQEYGIPLGSTYSWWFYLIAVLHSYVFLHSVRESNPTIFDLLEVPIIQNSCLLPVGATHTHWVLIASFVCVNCCHLPWTWRWGAEI
jgi:hypothetical protein